MPDANELPPRVVNNAAAHRFEFEMDGQFGILNYMITNGEIRLIHTEVPPAIRRRGYAAALVKTALEYAQREGLRVVPICPYVRAYLVRHPEYAGLTNQTPGGATC